MTSGETPKEHYKRLRVLPWERLWGEEVPRFDAGDADARRRAVSVVRAVGVVFSECGPAAQKEEVKQWLLRLLRDPEEKIRRYAMTALPKIGAGADEEAELLALLRRSEGGREEKFLTRTLDKIGGAATLEAIGDLPTATVQRVKASVARAESPSAIRLDAPVMRFARLRIHLRGRRGLEGFVREEVEAQGKFRVVGVDPGLIAVTPLAPFTLADVFALRCFGTVGIVLGLANSDEEIAESIAAPATQHLLGDLTEGAIRYRLEFVGKGHQRAAVRRIADRAFALCPRILNDAREAPWAVDIHRTRHGDSVELRPRFSPDPRYVWRLDDIPAASHPPLAACMARLAGSIDGGEVWDPFCGTGLELIERVLLGGVGRVHGSDLSAEAIDIAKRHCTAAGMEKTDTHFACCDFRDYPDEAGLRMGSLTLVITNPPLGRRVRIPNLRGLIGDLFTTAGRMLKVGGRLVFTNPVHMESPDPTLRLETRHVVDMGGFDCRVEMWRKTGMVVRRR